MRLIPRLFLTLLLTLASWPAWAQTALSTTSLSNAVTTTTANSLVVASATGIVAGRSLYIDRELMTVRSTYTSGTTIPVLRGVGGTVTTHVAGAIVYHAPAGSSAWRSSDRVGSCTAANEAYLPQINTNTGDRWDCPSALGLWINAARTLTVPCHTSLFTDSLDYTCFVADRPYAVVAISYVSKVVESGGTLTVIPRKQTGTQAPASGAALATAISGVSTVAETVTAFTLTTTPADLLLATGNRLGIDFTDDVAGELAGVTVTFTLAPR